MTGKTMPSFITLIFSLIFSVFAGNAHADEPEPIIIGIDADMSGAAADGGIAIYRGAQIAVDKINQAGGVLNRPLELIVKDHRGNPARGLRNLKQFNSTDNVVAVIGGVHTPVILQELDFIHQNQMLMLVPWAAGTGIIDNQQSPNFVFRVSVRDSEAANIILNSIKDKGLKNIALILERTGWGRSNQVSMTQMAEQLGLTISYISWINWRQKSFDDEMQLLAKSQPDAVVLVTNAPEGAVALRALLNNSVTRELPVVSHWGIAGGSFVELLGFSALQKLNLSVLQTFHFAQASNTALAAHVLEAYREKFDASATVNNIPGTVGLAHAYDLVHMLSLAIEKANTTDSGKVRKALKNLPSYSGLVKQYQNPFADKQDALWSEDYILTRYDQAGFLVPIQE